MGCGHPIIMHGILQRFLTIGRYICLVWWLCPEYGLHNIYIYMMLCIFIIYNCIILYIYGIIWVYNPESSVMIRQGVDKEVLCDQFPSCDCHVPMLGRSHPAWKGCLVETPSFLSRIRNTAPSIRTAYINCWRLLLLVHWEVLRPQRWCADGCLCLCSCCGLWELNWRYWGSWKPSMVNLQEKIVYSSFVWGMLNFYPPRPLAQSQQAWWQLATGTAKTSKHEWP